MFNGSKLIDRGLSGRGMCKSSSYSYEYMLITNIIRFFLPVNLNIEKIETVFRATTVKKPVPSIAEE
jgi:hypothetical protein